MKENVDKCVRASIHSLSFRFSSVDNIKVSKNAFEKVVIESSITKWSLLEQFIMTQSSILINSDDRVPWQTQYSSYKRSSNRKVGIIDVSNCEVI